MHKETLFNILKNLVIGSVMIWVANLGVIIIRLLPIVLIVMARGGNVPQGLIVLSVAVVLILVRIGGYLSIMRSAYNTLHQPAYDHPIALKIKRFTPWWWGAWILYLAMLALLLVV